MLGMAVHEAIAIRLEAIVIQYILSLAFSVLVEEEHCSGFVPQAAPLAGGKHHRKTSPEHAWALREGRKLKHGNP